MEDVHFLMAFNLSLVTSQRILKRDGGSECVDNMPDLSFEFVPLGFEGDTG